MSITKPTSGATITQASVTDMHDQARAVVNDLQPTNIGRSSINTSQLGTASVVQNCAHASRTVGTGYVTAIISKYEAGVSSGLSYSLVQGAGNSLYGEVNSWDTILSINAAEPSGVTYTNNSPMIINFNFRVGQFEYNSGGGSFASTAANGGTVTSGGYMIWFGVIIERTDSGGSAANIVIEESVVGVHMPESAKYNLDGSSFSQRIDAVDQAVSYTVMHTIERTLSQYTYGYVRIKAAISPCASAYAGASPSATASGNHRINVPSGFGSILILEPGA